MRHQNIPMVMVACAALAIVGYSTAFEASGSEEKGSPVRLNLNLNSHAIVQSVYCG